MTSMNNNILFIDNFTAEYNLSKINEVNALYFKNNIEFGGRAANFIIDIDDIRYYSYILDNIIFPNPISISNTNDLLKYITTICDWIHLRLNTRFLFRHKEWNLFNNLYVEKCFKKTSYTHLKNLKLTDTNIRNIFFGDCREHEVLLHVLTKMLLNKYNLQDKYLVRRLYAKGFTITMKELKQKNINSYLSPTTFNYSPKVLSAKSLQFGGDEDEATGIWDHTHPVLYDISNNTLYSIDALRHKTKWNSHCDVTHNSILTVGNMYPNAKCIPFVNYQNLVDGSYRTYIEFPVSYSNKIPTIIARKRTSLLFSNNFKLDNTKFTSTFVNIYDKYKIIDIGNFLIEDKTLMTNKDIYKNIFLLIIYYLCLTKSSKSSKATKSRVVYKSI